MEKDFFEVNGDIFVSRIGCMTKLSSAGINFKFYKIQTDGKFLWFYEMNDTVGQIVADYLQKEVRWGDKKYFPA